MVVCPQELCSAVGPVETVNMIAPGVAEVTYRYKDDALEAFKKYNQRNLDGQCSAYIHMFSHNLLREFYYA